MPAALFVLGAASTSLYFWGRDLHRFTQWLAAYIGLFIGQLALYLLATYVVLRWSDRSSRFARWAWFDRWRRGKFASMIEIDVQTR